MMNTFLGIAFDAWVNIDGDCPIAHEVFASEVQIELGHSAGSLHLVITEGGLHKLIQVAETAITEMRARNVNSGRIPQGHATTIERD